MDIRLILIATFIIVGLHANAEVKAHVNLEARSGSTVIGTVNMRELPDGLEVSYNIKGLKPGGAYGFHVHEVGDCSSKDAKSAGTHFHKIASQGGTSLDTPGAYAGDLPALRPNKNGVAKGTFFTKEISLEKNHPVKNLAIVVHGGPDDPTKSSPPRVACGLINEVKN